MADLAGLVEAALRLEVGDDPRVGVLDEETAIAGLPLEEAAVEADDVAHRDTLPAAQLQVGLAVGGRGVDDPGPLLHRHQLGGRQHQEGLSLGEHVGEQRLVGAADQLAAGQLPDDRVVAVEDLEAGPGEDQALPALLDLDVGGVGVDREGDVAGQGPGGGGPGEQ